MRRVCAGARGPEPPREGAAPLPPHYDANLFDRLMALGREDAMDLLQGQGCPG